MREQDAADDRPEADADPAHAGPDPDGAAALLRVGEDVGDDRQRRRHDERGADPHERARHDELRDAVGHRGGRRRHREEHQPDHQRALAAEAVAEAARGEQQAREHEHVGVDDPLEIRRGRVHVAHQRRQRHVEDRVVDPDDRDAQAQRQQREPSPLRDPVGLCHAAPMIPAIPVRLRTLSRREPYCAARADAPQGWCICDHGAAWPDARPPVHAARYKVERARQRRRDLATVVACRGDARPRSCSGRSGCSRTSRRRRESNADVLVEVEPDWGPAQVAAVLAKTNVVKSAAEFQAYAEGQGVTTFKPGRYYLYENEGASASLATLRGAPAEAIPDQKLLLPPGLTLAKIADRVGALKNKSRDRFLEVAKSGTVRSKFEPQSVQSLEGLTWPDTYFIGATETETQILQRHRHRVRQAGHRRRPRRARTSTRTTRPTSRRWCRPRPATTPTCR